MGIETRPVAGKHNKFTCGEIERAFEDAGYSVEKKNCVFERQIEDRIAMWRVPAVLDSLFWVGHMKEKERDRLLNEVSDKVFGKDTMPTTVAFFKCSLKP